jgi:hypothetical protein
MLEAEQRQDNAGDDFLDGEHGNDTIVAAGSSDGADFIEGGSCTDTASYALRGQRVTVSLDLLADGGPFNDLCFTDPGDVRISCES